MASVLLSLLLLLFSFTSISSSLSLSFQNLQNAAEILSNSSFVSMAIILESTPRTLIPSPSAVGATVFSPSDAAFSDSGQPPLFLLRYHICSQRLTPETLRSFSFGSKIRTLAPDLSLIITTSATDSQVSLNGVKINDSAVYDDGSLVVYGTDQFFDPSFQTSAVPVPSLGSPGSTLQCKGPASRRPFAGATDKLRSMGYSVMASFLDLQLAWDQTKATVFAPADGALVGYAGNFSEHESLVRRHIVPCRIKGGNLADLPPGAILPTFLEGFTISVDRSDGRSLLNGVPVSDEDMFTDGSIVVHGIHDVLNPLDTAVDFGP